MSESATPLRLGAFAIEIRASFLLAWPMVLTNLAQMGQGATDVVMMGWLGPRALAAGALGTNLYFGAMIFGLGLVTATAPMVARQIGRSPHSVRDVRRTLRQGLWSACLVSLPLWLLLWQAEPLLRLLGQDGELARDAALYLHALQWAILPFLAYLVLRSFLAALERPRAALIVMVFAILLNAFLAFGLMFGRFGLPLLGLVGAGIATTISSWAMFLGLAFYLILTPRFRRYRLFGNFWRPDWERLVEFWRIGLPIGATMALEVSVFNAAVFLMGLIGADSLAAHQIAIQIASLSFMVPMGLGQAASVRVGRALGSGDRLGVAHAGWAAFFLAESFMALMAILFLLVPERFVGVFLSLNDAGNAEVVRLAIGFLGWAALFQLVDGAQAVGSGMLRGLHDTRIPMLFAAFGYWGVGLPLGAFLAFGRGLAGAGIWIGLAAGLAVVAVLMISRWMRRQSLGLVG